MWAASTSRSERKVRGSQIKRPFPPWEGRGGGRGAAGGRAHSSSPCPSRFSFGLEKPSTLKAQGMESYGGLEEEVSMGEALGKEGHRGVGGRGGPLGVTR